ncbi:hypothetical protein Bca52824_026383 [Brassica carinata]|uniref:Uncharacterized protein n=1 Tax=Brassica carinata TaxID=52824 RepID=A0A8X7SHK2_BRACI|nr:hypothetical protein Bca52824_026383 [Brassica carinata]
MEVNHFRYHVFKVIDLDVAESVENGEGVRLIAPQDACKLQPFSQELTPGSRDSTIESLKTKPKKYQKTERA